MFSRTVRCNIHGVVRVFARPAVIATLTLASAMTIAAAAGDQTTIRSGERWAPRRMIVGNGINGVALLPGTIRGATIGPARLRGAYRAIETPAGGVLENATIAGITATELERDGIRLRTANNVTIRDFNLTMRRAPQTGRHLPEGIAIIAGRNITIRDGRVSGFRMVPLQGQYTNGDGIATEGEVDGLVIERVTASNNSDGGFDLKGRNLRIDQLTAERNSRAYRFWGDVQAGTITANGWTSAAVWAGRGVRVRIGTLVARNDNAAPLLIVDGQTDVEIGRCILDRPAGAQVVRSEGAGNRVRLGAGCEMSRR